jgi:hypothetical protein
MKRSFDNKEVNGQKQAKRPRIIPKGVTSHANCKAAFFPKYPRSVSRGVLGDFLRGRVASIVIPKSRWTEWAEHFPQLPAVDPRMSSHVVSHCPNVVFYMIVCQSQQKNHRSKRCPVHNRYSKRVYLAFHHKRLIWKSSLAPDGKITVGYCSLKKEPACEYKPTPPLVKLYDPFLDQVEEEYDPEYPAMNAGVRFLDTVPVVAL